MVHPYGSIEQLGRPMLSGVFLGGDEVHVSESLCGPMHCQIDVGTTCGRLIFPCTPRVCTADVRRHLRMHLSMWAHVTPAITCASSTITGLAVLLFGMSMAGQLWKLSMHSASVVGFRGPYL